MKTWLAAAMAAAAMTSAASAQVVLKTSKIQKEGQTITITLASGETVVVKESDVDVQLTMRLVDAINKSTASREVPPPGITGRGSSDIIRTKCAADFPTDFSSRSPCEDQQKEAVSKLDARAMLSAEERTIRKECESNSPDDYSARNSCEERRLEALKKLRP